MSAFAEQYVSVAKMCAAYTLAGEKALNPLKAGETIIGRGTFDDGAETGPGVFVVVRSKPNYTYVLAPLGSEDEYWSDHLRQNPTVDARILRGKEVPGADMELLRRWIVISPPGVAPPRSSLTMLGKKGTDEALRQWKFLADNVVAENDTPQEIMAETHDPDKTITVIDKVKRGPAETGPQLSMQQTSNCQYGSVVSFS